MRDSARTRAEGRLLVLGMMFFCAFGVIGARMGVLAATEPIEPRAAASAAIIERNALISLTATGVFLATNLETHSLYAQPLQMVDPERAWRPNWRLSSLI